MSNSTAESARSRRGIKLRKVLKRLLIVLLVYSLSSMLFSAVMFRLLYARRDGIPAYSRTYAELGGEAPPRETFTFRSGGNLLTGYRYPAEDPRGLILVINGIGAGADAHLGEIRRFLAEGWSVVTWDATGVGSSEGRGLIGLQQIRMDLLAYLDTDAAKNETLPVVLYGHSAGAYAAATALDSGYPIRAAVCVCGFDAPVSVMLHHARARVGPLADLQYPFLLLENVFLFGSDADDSAGESIGRSRTPVLLVESSSDDYVPHELALSESGAAAGNPNVYRLLVDAEWRNEHNTPWLSDDAAAYVGTLGPDEPVDKDRAGALDEAYMDQILAFFAAAVTEP